MTIQDLKDKKLLLLECISGSRAYGLETAKSDRDIKGVFYLPKDQFYGLNYIAQVNNESNDEMYYELGRFVELLVKNNPNMLELLATTGTDVLYKHPLMEHLPVALFLSKRCKDTFAGYALTQIKKARSYKKKVVNPAEALRKSVLDFCFIIEGQGSEPLKEWLEKKAYRQENCGLASIPQTRGMFTLFYDKNDRFEYRGIVSGTESDEVCLSSIPRGQHQVAYLYFNVESYSAYCRSYREYWDWVQQRNEERYRDNKEHGKDYDAKNMMHTIRLLEVAKEVLQTGKLNNKRTNREALLAIKNGLYEYEDLLEKAAILNTQIENVYAGSVLPEAVDMGKVEAALVEIRKKLYN